MGEFLKRGPTGAARTLFVRQDTTGISLFALFSFCFYSLDLSFCDDSGILRILHLRCQPKHRGLLEITDHLSYYIYVKIDTSVKNGTSLPLRARERTQKGTSSERFNYQTAEING